MGRAVARLDWFCRFVIVFLWRNRMYEYKRLRDPFPADDLEWRVQRARVKDGEVRAVVVPYVTNRAIMDRLDEVFGPASWENSFDAGPCGGIVCTISVWTGETTGWVGKVDGAENTDIEPVKGGLSSAMKRAAVQWGIGRYLYQLPQYYADVKKDGELMASVADGNQRRWFRYDRPKLPAWALPEGERGGGDRWTTETKEVGADIWKMLKSPVFTEAERDEWWARCQANADDVSAMVNIAGMVTDLVTERGAK